MWITRMRRLREAAVVMLALCMSSPSAAEPPQAPAPFPIRVGSAGDPCLFFRSQAEDKGLTDYTREMLWACEEIARRRVARMPLSDRLLATAAMLDAYRSAVIAATSEMSQRKRAVGAPPWALGLTDEEKHAIADATGALLVLEAIQTGY